MLDDGKLPREVVQMVLCVFFHNRKESLQVTEFCFFCLDF